MYDYLKIETPPVHHKIHTLTELYEFCRNEFEHEWRNNVCEIFNIKSHHLWFPGGVYICTHLIDIEGMFLGEATFTWKDPTHAVCYIEIKITCTSKTRDTRCLIKIPDTRIVIQLEFENIGIVHYNRGIINHETGHVVTAREREKAQPAASEYIIKHREFTWTYYRMIDDNVLHCRTVEVADNKLDKLMNHWDRILHMPADSITKMYDKGYEVIHNDH